MNVPHRPTIAVVVNDDVLQLTLLTELLRMEGLEVSAQQSAEAALAAMESLPIPAIIVTDLYMPGIDGWRFCRLLRSPSYPTYNQVPILVVSATFAGEEASRIAQDLGANAFLPAPVAVDRLRATVQALITGDSPRTYQHVLIVEDDATQAGQFAQAFAAQGFHVDTASTVAAAMEACARTVYDLAVLEYYLPDGDSGGLLENFRQQQPHCVCLIMTLDSAPQLALDLLKRGAAAFLNKPCDPHYLLEISFRALRERALLRVEDLLEERTRKLRDSEQRFRTMAKNAFDLVALLDEQGRYLFCNDSYLDTFGYSPQELLGTLCFDRVHPEQLAMVMERIESSLAQHRTTDSIELDIRHRQGQYLHIHYNARYLVDSQGNRHMLLNGRDITEQRAAEQERERLIRAIEQAGESIVITDTQGEIQYANPAFERTTGYSREEARGLNPRHWKSGVHDDAFYQHMWDTLERGETWAGRIVNKRKDGSLYTEDAVISPVRDAGGTTVSYVAVKRDVTEAIRLEEQLRQAQKMESIGRLAGGVAHDFNNMLGVILGRTEMCLEEILPSDPLRPFLEDIHQAAARSAGLTRQLLAFARKQTLTPQVLDLNATVSNLLNMLQRLIGENIALTWHPGDSVWPVYIDPSQIDQILTNLCVNARDAISGVGTIAIATENCPLEEGQLGNLAAGDYVCLRVSDNGCGMEKGMHPLIFDPFFTTKEVGKGTGLGLATIYGIVQQHHGRIEVHSEPGQGTTFSLYFPSHRTAPQTHAQSNPSPVPCRSRETILLVEDEPQLLEMTADMLKRQGYHVLEASGPQEAIRIASTHPGPIHLLLTDIIMPVMNGLELAKQLASMQPGLRLLFMSGYTADVIAHHGDLREDLPFIQKPFILKELAEKIRAVLEESV